MPGKLLLDTTVVVDLFKGDHAAQRVLSAADEVSVPTIVLGELFYGAARSIRPAASRVQVEDFAAAMVVLPCDEVTARHYGELKDLLRARGRPIPENDVWIAAVARQHGLTVVTRDAHFRELPGVPLLAW